MKNFLKATVVGGALFLVPIVLVLVILGYALQFAAKIARPIANGLNLDQLGEWSGIGAATIIGALVLVIVSFGAGILAGTNAGKRITRWLEESLLGGLPQYRLIKSMAEALAHIENASAVKPVLVNVGDGWQLGYLLERLENGWLAVFLPQAPTPMSGNVMYCPSDRVRPLDITMTQAMTIVTRIGAGSAEMLRGVDLDSAKTS